MSTNETPSSAAPGPASSRRRRRRWLALGVLSFLVLAGWGIAARVDRDGWEFFHAGEDIVKDLAGFARALKARDLDAVAACYSEAATGTSLGLQRPELSSERDGVRIYAFRGGEPLADRGALVAEWRGYLAGLAEVEDAGLHLHRLESWRGDELVAQVRFELIGTPQGEPRSGIDRGLFRMRFRRTAEGLRITRSEPLEADRVIDAMPHFVDVAAEAGVDFENRYYPGFFNQSLKFAMLRYGPAGITAADYDADGFYDLFIPDGEASRLFRNLGDGRFAEVTAEAGLAGLDGVSVGLFADYDNDGVKDFFVSRTFQPNQLFHGERAADGRVTFRDVTAASGIGADCCTTVASWGDIDNDGFLDLYVGRYLDPRESIPTTFYARNGEPNQLYHNNGDGTFTNITTTAGVGELGLCLGTVFADYDDDGDADLYVVNDFGRKTLYRNEGELRFRDVTVETGTLAYGAGMSASFGDYDNDGRLDIYVAHIRSEHSWFAEPPTVWRYMLNSWRQGVWRTDMPLYWEIFRQSGFHFVEVFQQMASGNTLLRNLGPDAGGEVRFEDTTAEAGANPLGWFWGSGFADFDNDGWQDIYAANGWVYNQAETELELEFLNNVVSEQREYKSGRYFDPSHFGGRSWHGWERNRYLRSRGAGADGRVTFEEIGRAAGNDLLLNSRGIAVADFWNRGVLDIAVAASTDRHALLRNQVGEGKGWLAVELVGAGADLPQGTNRDAVGARVTVLAGGRKLTREVALGDGYGAQNSLRLYFGLGEVAESAPPVVDELIVRWPRSGREQHFSNLAANRILEVAEGRNEPVEKVYPLPAGPAAGGGGQG